MSLGSRVLSGHGRIGSTPTLASQASMLLPWESNLYIISGSATITSLKAVGGPLPGRTVTFIGATGAGVVFTNTDDPTTAGQMDLGGANITLGQQDVLVLIQSNNGTWVRVAHANN